MSRARTATGRVPEPVRGRWALFLGLAVSVVVVDQVSKAWVDASFTLASASAPPGDPAAPTPVLGDLVRIAKVYNDGGIFGLFDAAAPILGLLSLVLIAGITWYQWRQGAAGGPLLTVGLGLLLGGALGNLIDRARFGYVIDFVDAGLGSFRWFAFNVADAAISLSLLILLLTVFVGDRLGPSRARRSSQATATPAGRSAADGRT
ncbi:signal peptidase II [soil metagenome]